MTDIDYYNPSIDWIIKLINLTDSMNICCNKFYEYSYLLEYNNTFTYTLGGILLGRRHSTISEGNINYYWLKHTKTIHEWIIMIYIYDIDNPQYILQYCETANGCIFSFTKYVPQQVEKIKQHMCDTMYELVDYDKSDLKNILMSEKLHYKMIDLDDILVNPNLSKTFKLHLYPFLSNNYTLDFNKNKNVYILLLCDGLNIPYDIFTVIFDLMFKAII